MEWGAADGLFEDDPDANYAKPTIRACSGSGSSESSIGCMSFDSSLGVLLGNKEGSGFEDLQTKLVANFAWKKAHNQIHWLRS